MFKPLNSRVLLKPDPTENVVAGIVLPESATEAPLSGTVIVGNKDVSLGDHVLFSRYGYDEIEISKEVFYVVSGASLLGILD